MRDHPRLCGEKFLFDVYRQAAKGSPPPMRGKATLSCCPASPDWITPAYAGKRKNKKWRSPKWRDHPRLCGEKARILSGFPAVEGSPPPMRGKVCRGLDNLHADGITPAYAGKRICKRVSCMRRRDHPRLCGEKQKRRYLCVLWLGSPPPMRGKGVMLRTWKRGFRITPAYAGKSLRQEQGVLWWTDHPRLCGEKVLLEPWHMPTWGSPPPMRGKVPPVISIAIVIGITPAYAGKSKHDAKDVD